MNSLTNIAGFHPHVEANPVSRSDIPPGPALPVGPLDPQDLKKILESQRYEELLVEYDVHEKIVWYFMNPTSRPSATVGLMQDIKRLQTLVRTVIEAHNDPQDPPIKYMALSSRIQGIFNLGGDLALFAQLIRERNREALDRYARLSIDVIHANSVNLDLPIITASVVQGDALGGGFEAALSSNLIIAERSAKFGLPEVLFNLFPGMGAYTFLARRIDPAAAEKMLLSGQIYTAEELLEAGVVDAVVEDGDGEQALYDHIIKHGRQFISHRSIYKVRGIVNPITYDEMARITDVWVDAAMSIGEDDLSRMERLASAQDRRWAKRG